MEIKKKWIVRGGNFNGLHLLRPTPSGYNSAMIKCLTLTLCVCLLLAGCITSPSSSRNHHERVSREIAEILAKAEQDDSIGDNIKITVNLLTTSVTDYFAINALTQRVYGDVTITNRPEIFTESGLQIGVAGENFRAQLDIAKRKLKSSQDSEIFLVLADGASGSINIGKEIAVPRFFYFGRWYNGIDYEFRRAGRSLEITARKLPSGLIEMELTPVFSRFLNDGGDLEMTELSTTVTARPDQTLVIGGDTSSGENVASAMLGYRKMGEMRETLITVTPHIK
ncbi:MAG: hypothetical protein HON76_18980 [Candidatus Scalindua sp.]|mgnify:FL=1|nr:hypothetical protein [Candidatus Scalindua sp.]MBT5306314.1 hypothetical protein [Candidatus Scalindua sp.]MBT6050145.1 hypothetical protein [Candidatus Scalindua sp.]MBT6230503.1 hypothetical protein [Candidatus Scalindua sp.]MBT6564604.1 hypothetical protein [Candidatus Scalindua sp.]